MDELTNKTPFELEVGLHFVKVLDHGAFGTVIHVIEDSTNKDYAIKVINKRGVDISTVQRMKEEISILKKLHHENIVKFYGFSETNKQLLIKMEYIKYGTLSKWIKNNKKISEEEASLIIRKVLSAVGYLHSKNICHRDIKPDNIMISRENDLTSIKIIDFGLSAQHFCSLNNTDYCGTFIYMAPEQIEKKLYCLSIDIWSIGILMYILLNNGKHPFYIRGDSKNDVKYKIKNNKLKFYNKLSYMAKNLLTRLLEKNPSWRYNADKAINHPWITRQKYDEIPLTFNEVLAKANNKKNGIDILLISTFLNYYKKRIIKNKETLYEKIKKNENYKKNLIYKINQEYLDKSEKINKEIKAKEIKLREKCLDVLSSEEDNSIENNFNINKIRKNLDKIIKKINIENKIENIKTLTKLKVNTMNNFNEDNNNIVLLTSKTRNSKNNEGGNNGNLFSENKNIQLSKINEKSKFILRTDNKRKSNYIDFQPYKITKTVEISSPSTFKSMKYKSDNKYNIKNTDSKIKYHYLYQNYIKEENVYNIKPNNLFVSNKNNLNANINKKRICIFSNNLPSVKIFKNFTKGKHIYNEVDKCDASPLILPSISKKVLHKVKNI